MSVCNIIGCENPIRYKKARLCNSHYLRINRHGRINLKNTPISEQISFLCNSINTESEECIKWPYSKSSSGYARISINGRMHNVHRIICESKNGQPKPGDQARHLCGKGKEGCINPKHLSWGTRIENASDKKIHGTENYGSRNGMSKLIEEEVVSIKKMIISGYSNKDISEKYMVSPKCISDIRLNKRWSHLNVTN